MPKSLKEYSQEVKTLKGFSPLPIQFLPEIVEGKEERERDRERERERQRERERETEKMQSPKMRRGFGCFCPCTSPPERQLNVC